MCVFNGMWVRVFNASFSSAALRLPLNVGGSSWRGHTPFPQIWMRTWPLKGTEVTVCVCVWWKTKTRITVLLLNRKCTFFFFFFFFFSNLTRKSIFQCLSVSLSSSVCHSVSVFYALFLPTPLLHIPTSLYLEVVLSCFSNLISAHFCHSYKLKCLLHTDLYILHPPMNTYNIHPWIHTGKVEAVIQSISIKWITVLMTNYFFSQFLSKGVSFTF